MMNKIKKIKKMERDYAVATFAGIVTRIILGAILLFGVFAAFYLVWLYFTTVDMLYMLGCYIMFGSLINLFIIDLIKRSIDKFVFKKRVRIYKEKRKIAKQYAA